FDRSVKNDASKLVVRIDPSESLVLSDIAGNMLHTAGRYGYAEIALRHAKRLALAATPSGLGDFRLDETEFYATIPESDWKWRWATTFDLGSVLLSRGDYRGAVRQFDEALEIVRSSLPR